MKKRFKKIYIEITNCCNLNCYFCKKNKRKKEYMSISEFKHVLASIKGYTDYIYLHLMGEALMHPKINELIDLASKNFLVNITTNGYMIEKIMDNKNIRQVNISLQSFIGSDIDNYLNKIFQVTEKLVNFGTIVNYRLWVDNNNKNDFILKIENYYNVKINGNTKLRDKVYIDFKDEFMWPSLDNNYYNLEGKCLGLVEQMGILVDGTVVACCLDSEGNINLGNIFEEKLDSILNKERTLNILEGFKNNKKIEELCRHCNFYEKRKNTKKRLD